MDHNNDMNLNLLQPYKKILDLSNDDDDVPFRFQIQNVSMTVQNSPGREFLDSDRQSIKSQD